MKLYAETNHTFFKKNLLCSIMISFSCTQNNQFFTSKLSDLLWTLFPLSFYTLYSLYPLMPHFDDSSISLITIFDAFFILQWFGLFYFVYTQLSEHRWPPACLQYPKDITWFTCVINKTKHRVDLPKFKMAAWCTRCIFGFKTRVLSIILTNNDVMHSILETNDLFRKGLCDFKE